MNKPMVIEGTEVTLLDANHCPGAAMFLIKTIPGYVYLHVGDFRWHEKMKEYPALRAVCPSTGSRKRLEAIYLDTTYLNPKYDFPKQAASILAVRKIVVNEAAKNDVLFLFGAYSIGKERVFMEVRVFATCRL